MSEYTLEQSLAGRYASTNKVTLLFPYGRYVTIYRKLRNPHLTGVQSKMWSSTPVRQWEATVRYQGNDVTVWGWSGLEEVPTEWHNDRG